MSIVDTIYSYLPTKKKMTPSGWTKFNAVCCHHNGTSADTRARGGFIRNGDGCSYHCFNCGYKASYQPGRHLTRKMRSLLSWLGAPDDAISKLSLEALKIQEDQQILETISLPTFDDRPLPDQSMTIDQALVVNPEAAILAADYILNRGFDILNDYDFRWSPEFPDRLIVPFYYEGRTVGYTARKLTDGKPKYLSEQTPGYVFNLDQQKPDWKHVIVVEGPMDALSVNGVAVLGADIMDKQAMLINRLGKTPIVVPDRDQDGQRTVERAVELGWAVSMPEWDDGVKDANDAMRKYGKLYTIYSIIAGAETSEIKIKLRSRQWFSEKY
jgi:hypothetical protein